MLDERKASWKKSSIEMIISKKIFRFDKADLLLKNIKNKKTVSRKNKIYKKANLEMDFSFKWLGNPLKNKIPRITDNEKSR